MSWDIWVEMSTGGEEPLCGESRNYTHNCNEMMRRSLDAVGRLEELGKDHLYALDGLPCSRVAEMFEPALAWWDANRALLLPLEPDNHWGDEGGAREFWGWVLGQCRSNPLATLRVSG